MGTIIDHSNRPEGLPPNETRPPRTDDLRIMTLRPQTQDRFHFHERRDRCWRTSARGGRFS
jgi:hypothetical protein